MSEADTSRAPPRHLRTVGTLEWFLHARTKAHADSCVIVAARYIPSHSGDIINKASLFPALGEVVRRNVVLASRIAPPSGKHGRPEWVRLPSLDLDRVVEFVNDDFGDLESVFECQFKRGFDSETDLPLWRLAVLKDSTVIFAFDHAICDGLSGLAFHRVLLKALQEDRTCPISVEFPKDQTLAPPLEEAMEVPVPWGRLCGEMLKAFNPMAWRRHFATWTGNPVPKSFELDMCVHVLNYDRDEALRLVQTARAHSATLTAMLHTVALLVLSRLLDKYEHGKYKLATSYVPISLRRFTGASPDEFCNHYSYCYSEHRLFAAFPTDAASFPWSEAAEFAQRLKAEAPHASSWMGLMKLVGSPGRHEEAVRRPLGQKRIIALELSNLGPFSLKPGEEGPPSHVATPPPPAASVAEAETEHGEDDASVAADPERPAEAAESTFAAATTSHTTRVADGEHHLTPPGLAPDAPAPAGDATIASAPATEDESHVDTTAPIENASANAPVPAGPGTGSNGVITDNVPIEKPKAATLASETTRDGNLINGPIPVPTEHADAAVQTTNGLAFRPTPDDPSVSPVKEFISTPHGPTGKKRNGPDPTGKKDESLIPPRSDARDATPTTSTPAPAPGQARGAISTESGLPRETDSSASGHAQGVGNGIPGGQEPPPLWSIREVVFAQADGTLGAAIKVCVAGTPSGGLGVAITWGKSAVDEEFGKEFVVGFADGLREFVVESDGQS